VDERCEKVFLPAPHPPPSKSTLSPRKRVILDDGFCDFAFGSAQNDSTEDYSRIMRGCSLREIIRSYQ
jgi:hypothetical protein